MRYAASAPGPSGNDVMRSRPGSCRKLPRIAGTSPAAMLTERTREPPFRRNIRECIRFLCDLRYRRRKYITGPTYYERSKLHTLAGSTAIISGPPSPLRGFRSVFPADGLGGTAVDRLLAVAGSAFVRSDHLGFFIAVHCEDLRTDKLAEPASHTQVLIHDRSSHRSLLCRMPSRERGGRPGSFSGDHVIHRFLLVI